LDKNEQTGKTVKDVTKGGSMIRKSNKPNRQVERTKSWIFDALMLLMDEKPYDKITVSDIADKAGVARPTFYRNYIDKDEVILQYLNNSFNAEIMGTEKVDKGGKPNNIILTFDVTYLNKNQKNLKKILSTADVEARIYRELQVYTLLLIKNYKKQLSAEEYLICHYKICYQITGSLKVLFDWFINNMPMPIEKLVPMLNAMNIPKTVQYSNIPGVEVRIKEE
jgi:AcrR family transcriptional regulator